jgi:hypothetical protein
VEVGSFCFDPKSHHAQNEKNYTFVDCCSILDVVVVEVPHDKKTNCAICCNVSFVI